MSSKLSIFSMISPSRWSRQATVLHNLGGWEDWSGGCGTLQQDWLSFELWHYGAKPTNKILMTSSGQLENIDKKFLYFNGS